MATEDTDSNSLDGSSSQVIETDSLETPSNNGPSDGTIQTAPSQAGSSAAAPGPRKKPGGIKKFGHRINIYLLMFILVLVVAGAILVITAFSQHTVKDPTIASQSLSTATLTQLSKTDTTVGDPKQILNIQSNAVFAGKVLIRDSLDVAGQIHVSGSLTLPGITVSGDSTFDQVQVNKTLSIGGDASVLGQLNVKKSLSVTAGGTFGGIITAPQIATDQLQLLGDLTMTRHIIAGGATPGKSNGGALGSGGTASVSGSDTAGSVNINVGGGAAAGCFVTINFNAKFNNTPHIVISPTNSASASLSYYVAKGSNNFSICSNSTPASGIYGFDYIIIG